ncbi:hypothetical protein NUSPORA_00205 [Nucleospora cyclopteri]
MNISLNFFIAVIKTRTLIIPINHKNHRLSLREKPIIINSSLNEGTRSKDFFKIPPVYTFLSDDTHSVCYNHDSSNIISSCKRTERRRPWRIIDAVREVRFQTDDNKCLTVGEYFEATDTYSVINMPCDLRNNEQVFILNKEHGKSITDFGKTVPVEIKEVKLSSDATQGTNEAPIKAMKLDANYDDRSSTEDHAEFFARHHRITKGEQAKVSNARQRPQRIIGGNDLANGVY